MMKTRSTRLLSGAASLLALFTLLLGVAQATTLSTTPLQGNLSAKPNLIFGLDDSGSMDFELLLNTDSGGLQWDTSTQRAWSGGKFLAADLYSMFYLFPMAQSASGMMYDESATYGKAVPPTPQFAALRSSTYNPLYYDPAKTYLPWAPANISGQEWTFGNASTTAALSHPLYPSGATMNLSSDQTRSFFFRSGMRSYTGSNGSGLFSSDSWTNATYYPATYWVPDSSCTANNNSFSSGCVNDTPDGRSLRRVEIKSGNTAAFPVVPSLGRKRTYAEEIQNFANWWSYYRKRKLMLAGAMGRVLDDLAGVNLAVVRFNNVDSYGQRPDVSAMLSADVALNRRIVTGAFYANPSSGGTPTTATLQFIGQQYRRTGTGAPITSACQRNSAFIVTDGFANDTKALPSNPGDYSRSTYGGTSPYNTFFSATQSENALFYYTINLRPDLPAGRVPVADASATGRNLDRNPNLHMNTYAITLGARGTVGAAAAAWPGDDPWIATSFTWPQPSTDQPTMIDDLWHATINGRGQMYLAADPDGTAARIAQGVNEVKGQGGGQSAVGVVSTNLRRGSVAFVSVYGGDIVAYPMSPSTGAIDTSTKLWSAAANLKARDLAASPRVIASHSGNAGNGSGVPFTKNGVGALLLPSGTDAARTTLVAYLRGDRSLENSSYRARNGLLGPVLNAQPVVSVADNVVYAASGEGMLHAFDATDGTELWAYAPYSALADMKNASDPSWTGGTLLDGTPVLATLATGARILVGSRGVAGKGYYALDVSAPRDGLDAGTARADKVLWEFPARSTTTVLGAALGRPVVVFARKWNRDVVLIPQGYNGSSDGTGRLYVLDAADGSLLHTFTYGGTGRPSSGLSTGDPGLAQVSALQESDGSVATAFGGDEQGNLWRFDLGSSSAATLSTTPALLAVLKDAAGNRQPITAEPELGRLNGSTLVMVSTGRLLGDPDLGATSAQSFYVIKDGSAIANVRDGTLVARALSVASSTTRTLGGASAFSWGGTARGWYVDLPAGQQAHTAPDLGYGLVAFTANLTSRSDCSTEAYLYVFDAYTASTVTSLGWAGLRLGTGFTASPVTLTATAQGTLLAQVQKSSGGVFTQQIVLSASIPPRKTAWRLVTRQQP